MIGYDVTVIVRAYGGSNQFIKALRSYFINQGIYSDEISDADVVLFNSMNQLQTVLKMKKIS